MNLASHPRLPLSLHPMLWGKRDDMRALAFGIAYKAGICTILGLAQLDKATHAPTQEGITA